MDWKFASEFNFHDAKGNTPLFEAVVNKNVEVVHELVKIGVDVNAKCENGNTCLHRIMLCQDGDPKNEQIINILLNNGQITRKVLLEHQWNHKKSGEGDYEMLMDRNVSNIRMLNDMNKTALYYSTKTRKKNFGWGHEVGNILKFDHMIYGDNKSKADRAMIKLQKKVTKDEEM